MTDKTDDIGKGAQKPASDSSGSKKPSAILDLKAKEIASEPPKPTGPATPKSAAQASAAASATATTAGATGKSAAPPSTEAPKTSQSATAAAAQSARTNAAVGASAARPSEQKPAGAAEPGKAGSGGAGGKAGDPPASKAPAAGSRPSIGNLLTHALAGLIGGFLALLLADTLGSRLGLQKSPQPLLADDFSRRLESAEQALKSRSADPGQAEFQQKLAALEQRLTRVDEVASRLNQLADSQSKLAGETQAMQQRLQQPDTSKELGERVARLDQAMAALRAVGANDPQAGRVAQLAAITGKLNDLESTLATQVAALRKGIAQEIDSRLAPVAEASEAAKSGTQRIDRELADLKTEAARLGARADALKATDDAAQQTVRTVQDETGNLRSALDGLKAETAAQLKAVTRPQDVAAALAPVASQIAALEQTVKSVSKSEEDRKVTAERIVLALELGNLKRAIDRGGSYAADLGSVKKIAGGQIDLAPLERYKDQGIATPAELTRDFRSVANTMIDADTTPADQSTLDRLLRGAKSIVRVRRTDARPEDAGAEATVGRMEKALNAGNLDEVLTEASRLSARARDAADPWLTRLDARATVDRALARIEDQLKATISGKAADKRT